MQEPECDAANVAVTPPVATGAALTGTSGRNMKAVAFLLSLVAHDGWPIKTESAGAAHAVPQQLVKQQNTIPTLFLRLGHMAWPHFMCHSPYSGTVVAIKSEFSNCDYCFSLVTVTISP